MTLTPTVFFLVLLAAVCHATWNALVKSGSDKLVLQALVIGGPGLACLPLLFFVPPPAPESWPYLLTSTVVHQIYYVVLIYAYRSGDLSQVYPISRGTAPAMIALLALLFAGERLSGLEWLGLAILSVGIASISRLASVVTGLASPREGELRAVALALVSALTISIYSFCRRPGCTPVRVSRELHHLALRPAGAAHRRHGLVAPAKAPARGLRAEPKDRPDGRRRCDRRLCHRDLGHGRGPHGPRRGAARDLGDPGGSPSAP